jgi:hypothetical protein
MRPMPGQWYFAREGKKQGPVTVEQLKGMVTSGQLNPKDMVLEDGTAKWTQAGSIQGLFEMPAVVAMSEPGTSGTSPLVAAQPQVPLPPPLPAPSQWYYVKNGQQYGPIEEAQLLSLLGTGQLQPTDMAWKAGTPTWVPMGQAFSAPQLAPVPVYLESAPLSADEWLAKRIGVKSPVGQSIVLGAVPVTISLIWLMLMSERLYLGWFILSVLLFIGAAVAGGIGGAIQSSKGRDFWAGVRLGLFWYDVVVAILFILWFVLSIVCGVSFVFLSGR